MPAVAIRSTVLTSTHVKWLQPEPLWTSSKSEMTTPFVAEFDKDSFLPDFLTMMASSTITLNNPHDVQTKKDTKGPALEVMKLYQPLHQHYYLVMGSLVCRQFGLPDHTVVAKNGEKTSFVLRRFINGVECGWVNDGPNKGWQPLVDAKSRAVLIRKDEQRLPLHPVKTCASTLQGGATNGNGRITCNQRKVYYGYIPVDGREKYLSPAQPTDIAQAIKDHGGDLRLDDVQTRVIGTWRGLYHDPMKSQITKLPSDQRLEQLQQISLYMLLDLGDFLKTNLSDVFNAITNNKNLDTQPKSKALFDELGRIFVDTTNSANQISLVQALQELKDFLGLVQGQGNEPTTKYNVYSATLHYATTNPLIAPQHVGDFQKPDSNEEVYAPRSTPPSNNTYIIPVMATYVTYQNNQEVSRVLYLAEDGILANLIKNALIEAGTAVQLPPEMTDLIKIEPVDGDVYFLRLVYEYGDGCVVVSDPSRPFTFAKPFDPDAPARHVRIELPSIKLSDLRKFKRGVGMQSSGELHQLTNNLSLDALSKGNIPPPSAGGIGMICSFSIQIITLVAFIVMFIFLIALNIIFWWLPFIKICFPVPKPNKVEV